MRDFLSAYFIIIFVAGQVRYLSVPEILPILFSLSPSRKCIQVLEGETSFVSCSMTPSLVCTVPDDQCGAAMVAVVMSLGMAQLGALGRVSAVELPGGTFAPRHPGVESSGAL